MNLTSDYANSHPEDPILKKTNRLSDHAPSPGSPHIQSIGTSISEWIL